MAALAREGLDRLAAAQHAASAAAGGGAAGFEATGRAYVRSALASPALFLLIFASPSAQDLLGEPERDVPEAMAFLRANAAALAPKGAEPGAVHTVALHAWALAHGLAMLMLDGQAPADPALVDRVLNAGAFVRK